MNALQKSIDQNRALVNTARADATQLKMSGAVGEALAPAVGSIDFSSGGKERQQYNSFRGWVYSAIHALALEGASQPVLVGRLSNEIEEGVAERRNRFFRTKMPDSWMRRKNMVGTVEILDGDPLVRVMEQPNPIQTRSQFVYSFITNLNLTGWAFIVRGDGENGEPEYYSLPSSWVKPLHKNGPFSEFKIVNPKKPQGGEGDILTRDQVGFAYLPNPADPLGALAPISSQWNAAQIDNHIQTSQEQFFKNGIFPSVVVQVGKNPHPDGGQGVRPRLTPAQRRQVHAVIRKTMAGVANYGNPAIVDGMIESITRMSATQNEMGWEKSETKVKFRILSAFGVHPFILGEPVSVGGHAQAAIIEGRFCKRVNVFLDMLSTVMTNLENRASDVESLLIWWEKCEAIDQALRSQNLRDGRKNGDITRDEFRAELGYPPAEEMTTRSKLLDMAAGMQGVSGWMTGIAQGTMTSDQVVELMVEFLGISHERAQAIVGNSAKKLEQNSLDDAIESLNRAVASLGIDPKLIATGIRQSAKQLSK